MDNPSQHNEEIATLFFFLFLFLKQEGKRRGYRGRYDKSLQKRFFFPLYFLLLSVAFLLKYQLRCFDLFLLATTKTNKQKNKQTAKKQQQGKLQQQQRQHTHRQTNKQSGNSNGKKSQSTNHKIHNSNHDKKEGQEADYFFIFFSPYLLAFLSRVAEVSVYLCTTITARTPALVFLLLPKEEWLLCTSEVARKQKKKRKKKRKGVDKRKSPPLLHLAP